MIFNIFNGIGNIKNTNYYTLIVFLDSIKHHYLNIYYSITNPEINDFGIDIWSFIFFSTNKLFEQ